MATKNKPGRNSVRRPPPTTGGRRSRPFNKGNGRSGGASAKKKSTDWDQAARWYDALVGQDGSDYQRDIIMPGAYRLLDMKKGRKVLDLACGQGVFSRFLSQKGLKVTGLDASESLIQYAKSRSHPAMAFHSGDAASEKSLPGETFDGIVCLMAVQNMEHLEPVLRNISRWLVPGGRFVMVMMHPTFRIPRQSHWGWDEEKKLEYRRVDLYLTETSIPIFTPPMRTEGPYTWTYHRPLHSYFDALLGAGLTVSRFEEWASNKKSQPGKRAKAENRARQEIPLFLAMAADKPKEA